jgi:hypothetical protein
MEFIELKNYLLSGVAIEGVKDNSGKSAGLLYRGEDGSFYSGKFFYIDKTKPIQAKAMGIYETPKLYVYKVLTPSVAGIFDIVGTCMPIGTKINISLLSDDPINDLIGYTYSDDKGEFSYSNTSLD